MAQVYTSGQSPSSQHFIRPDERETRVGGGTYRTRYTRVVMGFRYYFPGPAPQGVAAPWLPRRTAMLRVLGVLRLRTKLEHCLVEGVGRPSRQVCNAGVERA